MKNQTQTTSNAITRALAKKPAYIADKRVSNALHNHIMLAVNNASSNHHIGKIAPYRHPVFVVSGLAASFIIALLVLVNTSTSPDMPTVTDAVASSHVGQHEIENVLLSQTTNQLHNERSAIIGDLEKIKREFRL